MIRRSLLALAAALAAACGPAAEDAATDAVSARAAGPGNAGGNKPVTVMTRNLYVGGDLFLPFVSPDPLGAAAQVWGDILASDPTHRMVEIAAELRAARPDLVALEEVYRFVVTPLGATSPVLLDLDFLAALEAALAATGDPLRVVAVQPQTTLTVPFPAQGIQVTIIDRDAVLADEDVVVRSAGGGSFDAAFATTLAGVIPVRQTRGWVEVAARHQGVPFTFVATHLEVKTFGPLQSLQALELLGRFGAGEATILAGDLNSAPDDPPFPVPAGPPVPTPYQLLASGGFRDAAGSVGDTCCYAADLRPPSELDERVDLVLVRGALTPISAYRVGTTPLEALDGRWPSDHAGVVATVRLEDPRFFGLAAE